ncbi:hypothetical protein MAR_016884 [Mya arenaria]|uniref:Uncharacterized protein n=1 Tax=Mya arenaria TaxID=6604 RepID=A0ABY7EIC8_MYAAR|nr:hypothetical protein MAR_016884 [Mya arenaria]
MLGDVIPGPIPSTGDHVSRDACYGPWLAPDIRQVSVSVDRDIAFGNYYVICNGGIVYHSARTQDLYNYLVLNHSRTFDNQNINARKQLKVKVSYEDGHVHSLKYNQISHKCSHCYVRAKVIPSLPGSGVKKRIMNHVPVCLKYWERFMLLDATLLLGEGESCNHVAALLYALVDIGSKLKDGLNAPTSTKCKWNQPRKRKTSPQRSQHLLTTCTRLNPLNSLAFGEKLKKCAPNAAFLLSESELVAPKEPIPVLHKL